MVWLLVAFILVPALEIGLFIQIGGIIGALPTIALILLTAFLGTMLLRSQGLSTIERIRASVAQNRVPGSELAHGAMIVLAGLLLLTPGFFTDAVGFLLFIPPFREALFRFLAKRVIIVERQTPPGTVDLDTSDWQRTETPAGTERTGRLSPWRNDGLGSGREG